MVLRAACLCQPEALNLDLPEVQVKHWHNDLFLEQTEDMNLPTLAGACKNTDNCNGCIHVSPACMDTSSATSDLLEGCNGIAGTHIAEKMRRMQHLHEGIL